MDITTLADIPALGTDHGPRSQITVARLGKYQDARYGKFEISEADYDGWKDNLATTFGGRVSVDFDHSSDRGRGTEAAAWITGLGRQGKDVIADVEWTPKGAAAVRDKSYMFISPTYTEHYKDEEGVDRGRALLGAACTNRPVLRKLPTLSLSREPIEGAAVAESERDEPAPSRDSRRQMDTAQLAKLLSLPEDSDEAAVLAKVTELATAKPEEKPEEKPEPTTLEKPEAGTITLSAEQAAKLMADANAGAAAAVTLAQERFDRKWQAALDEGRAAPAQHDTLLELHEANPDLAVKTLESFVKIVPTKPSGSGQSASVETPAGMDEERYQLHTQAKTLAAEKVKADPNLPADEAYMLALGEISESQFELEHPGI